MSYGKRHYKREANPASRKCLDSKKTKVVHQYRFQPIGYYWLSWRVYGEVQPHYEDIQHYEDILEISLHTDRST